MDGLGSASPPVAPTATTGEGRHPCTWPRTFWFKPLSAFGLLDLTTFISSSPELAMPSTLAPNRFSASSRRALSREARPPWVGEVTLSQELRTARSPRPHVLVGYQWSHTGLRPGRKTSHNRYIRSFVSHLPQIRACRLPAPASSSHEVATSTIRRRYVDMDQVSMYLACFPSMGPETAPVLSRGPSGRFPRFDGTMGRCDSLPPVSPRFVSFAGRYQPGVPGSSPSALDAGPWIILELFIRSSLRLLVVETAGSPKFPEEPL